MKLATIQKIHSIQPHPNADKLLVAKVLGWPVVIKKDEFQDGQLVIFIQIDSIVPSTNPFFKFMEKQKYRIWNARFRGSPSQGLVCPLSIVPAATPATPDMDFNNPLGYKEGDDVTEILGVTKYEKPIDTSISGDAKGRFPLHLLSITDEDNLLNFPYLLEELNGKEIYITKKADGSSATIINDKDEIRVCSRRLEQKEGGGFWIFFNKYDLPNKLKTLGKRLALQGEACGGRIQGNPLGLNEPTLFIFNVKEFNDTEHKWYGKDEISELCKQLNIPMVEIIKTFVWDNSVNTLNELQELANSITYVTPSGEVRKGEGIVIRPSVPFYSTALGKMFSVKIINQDYKQ